MKPTNRPAIANFSSGPCAKRPGYSLGALATDTLGRSHRSALGKARLAKAIAETKAVLGIPADYRVGIVPASDTGAFEMAMWNLLGARAWTRSAGSPSAKAGSPTSRSSSSSRTSGSSGPTTASSPTCPRPPAIATSSSPGTAPRAA